MKNTYIFSFKENNIFLFIFKIILFLFIGITFLSITGFILNYFFPVKLPKDNIVDYFNKKKDSFNLVAFGNSHIRAIDVKKLETKSVNLEMIYLDVYTMINIAKKMIVSSKDLRTLIMPIDEDYILMDRRYAKSDITHLETYARIPIMPWEMPLKNKDEYLRYFDKLLYYQTKIYYLMRPDNWEGVLNSLRGKVKSSNNNRNYNLIDDPFDDNRVKRRVNIYINNSINDLTNINLDKLYERLYNVLDSLVIKAEQNNTKIILFNAPFSKIFENEYIHQSKIDIMNLRNISRKKLKDWIFKQRKKLNICLIYIDDIWDLTIDGNNPNYFYDSHHLNEIGGKIFTERLKVRINSYENCKY